MIAFHTFTFYNLISAFVWGYDKVWFIGNDFMSKRFAQYFQNVMGDSEQLGYIKAHYDITGYCQGAVATIS